MLKKLQNLLFEDEEVVDEEEYEEDIPAPVVRKKPERVKQAVVTEQPKPSMKRIDVTQPIKTPVQPKYEEPVASRQESVFRTQPQVDRATPTYQSAPVQEKPRTTSLTIDDIPTSSPKPVTPSAPVYQKPKATVQPKPRKQTVAYEFNPVISPIFGVDEKDVDAVQNTGKVTVRKASGKDEFVSKVISPMYGSNIDAGPSTVQKTVEKSNEFEELTPSREKKEAEDSVPEFSLDDILSVRDEIIEDSKQPTETEEDTLLDETILMPRADHKTGKE